VTSLWCERVLVGGEVRHDVRLVADDDGRIADRRDGVRPEPGDVRLGLVLPGFADTHSHLFHRVLRGRTHGDGGDFWAWRSEMYAAARRLTPELYQRLAVAVFGELVENGWTAVGEFHYVHHRPDGTAYPDHDMELALVSAALEVGIRLTLLDTCYLAGGIGAALSADQHRFGDAGAEAWLDRWHALRSAIERATSDAPDLVTLGAAVHSVRAVPPDAISAVLAGLPGDVPLHIHLSEQPAENAAAESAYGRTPTALLRDLGALSPRLSVVHATHVTEDDIRAIAEAGATVVICPTTEADLGDGIGPALDFAAAGAPIAVGSDQNAVIDPFLELRGLEAGERLRSGRRGRFAPADLLSAGTGAGYRALGLGQSAMRVGDPLDLVELDAASSRTVGSRVEQIVLAATGSDVVSVHVGGRRVHTRGSGRAAERYATVLAEFGDDASGDRSGARPGTGNA
jgi:formiminoglutamate deiminase